jgi:hypothetical protein
VQELHEEAMIGDATGIGDGDQFDAVAQPTESKH